MLNIIIVLVLIYGFYKGYRRGLVAQLVRLVGYLVTFVLASRLSGVISQYIEKIIPFPAVQLGTQLAFYDESMSFVLDKAFYKAISFVIVGVVGWVVTYLVSLIFKSIAKNTVFKYVNSFVGGILNVGVSYVGVLVVLFILSLIPIESIQQMFVDNPLAYWIVSQTPFLSDYLGEIWFNVNPF